MSPPMLPPPPPMPMMIEDEEDEVVLLPSGVGGLYVMGYASVSAARIMAELGCVGVVVDGTAELFFFSDDKTQKMSDRAAEFLRVQLTEEIDDPVQGAACVARLIERRLAQLIPSSTSEDEDETRSAVVTVMHEGFFDAYRVASDQRAHPLDPRMWAMPTHALARVRREHRGLCQQLHNAIKERHYLAQNIEHYQSVLQTTRCILERTQVVTPDLLDLVLEEREAELRALEAREIELLRTIDDTQTKARQLCLLLQRQTMILCFERVNGEPEGGAESRKRRRVD